MKPSVRFSAVLLLSLAACQVPDVAPFVVASQQVRSGILRSGDALRVEIETIEAIPGYPKQDPLQSKAFATLWKARVQVADAMIGYANSLQSIAAAAKGGETSGERLAQSVQALGEAAGVMPGGKLATGIAADLVKVIVGQIAQIRGTTSMLDSMEAADPAIQGIAGILRQDLGDSDSVLRLAVQLQLNNEKAALADNLHFRDKLIDEQKQIYKGAVTAPQETRLIEIDKQLRLADEWYLPYVKGQDALRGRMKTERELLAACGQALDEWAQTHHQMTLALREGHGFSVDSLLVTAGEIRDIVKRMQNHE